MYGLPMPSTVAESHSVAFELRAIDCPRDPGSRFLVIWVPNVQAWCVCAVCVCVCACANVCAYVCCMLGAVVGRDRLQIDLSPWI